MAEYIKLDNLYDIIEYDNDIDKWTVSDEDLNSLPKARWISVSDHLPNPEEEVRLFCKTKYGNSTYQCQGFYIPEKMDAEESEFNWDWEILEYDGENDVNYVQSGWYERIHNWDDYGAVAINDEVLYWMPLPNNTEG